MRMVERVDLVEVGRSKSLALPSSASCSVRYQHPSARVIRLRACEGECRHTGGIAYLNSATSCRTTIPEDAEREAIEGTQRYGFYDWCGEDGDQKKTEG